MAKWQDAPVVEEAQPRWMQAPEVETESAEPLADIEARQTESLKSYPSLYDAPSPAFQPEPDIGLAVEPFIGSGIPEHQLVGMAAATAAGMGAYSQTKDFAEVYREKVDRRRYQGFWDEIGVNWERTRREWGSAFLGTFAKLGEMAQDIPSPYRGATMSAGVNFEVEKEAAASLWEEAQGFKYQPGEGGGVPGFIAQTLSSIVPYVGLTLGAGLVAGPVGAFGTTVVIEGNQGYREALADKQLEEAAMVNGALRGIAVGLLETLQLSKLVKFGRGAKAVVQKEFAKEVADSAAKKIAKSAVVIGKKQLATATEEAFIEVLQEWAGDGTAFLVYGKTPEDLANRTAMAAAGGFIGALMLGPAFMVINGTENRSLKAASKQGSQTSPETDVAPEPVPALTMDEYAEKMRAGEDPLPPMVMSEYEYAEYERLEAERIQQLAEQEAEQAAGPDASGPDVRAAVAEETPAAQAVPDAAGVAEEVMEKEPSSNDVILEARRQHDQGTGRFKQIDWTIADQGTVIEAVHSITGNPWGSVDLQTGKIIAEKPGREAVLQELYDSLVSAAAKSNEKYELERLMQYPARNKDEIIRIATRNQSEPWAQEALAKLGPTGQPSAQGQGAAVTPEPSSTGAAPALPEAQVLTFDEYSAQQGVSSTPPSFPETHRTPGGVSKPSQRAKSQQIERALEQWQADRDRLRAEYNAKVKSGEIRSPTDTERLQQVAQGEGEAAEAAQRVLAKRAARAQPPTPTPAQPPIAPPAASGEAVEGPGSVYRFKKVSKAIEEKDFDTLRETLVPDPEGEAEDIGLERARAQFEDETGITLPESVAGTENTLAEFVAGRLSPVRNPRMAGGAQAGGTTIIPDMAAEIASIAKTVVNNPIRLLSAVWETLKRNIPAATTYMRTLGEAGVQTADELDTATYHVTRKSNTDMADIREMSKGVAKHQREQIAQLVNERISSEGMPQWIMDRVVALRAILDRAMKEGADLGMMRKLASGEKVVPEGSGKAYPQIPNAEGLRFLEEAYTQGQGSSRVLAWAQEQVEAQNYRSVDEAIKALVQFRDSRFRGINAYLERIRVELPVEMVEWDYAKTLPTVIERNWMTVEGVRKWGVDFERLYPRIEEIREQHGADAAQRVKSFIQTSFGIESPASRSAQAASNIIRGFQFITKVGLSPLGTMRNMLDRIAKGMMISPMSTIRTFFKYPPFLNAFIPACQRLEDQMIRNGAVFGHGALSEGYEAGSYFADLAKSPFSASERGNQVFIAAVAYDKLMHDMALLHKANPEAMGRIEKVVRTVFGQSPSQATERVGPDIAAKIAAGEEVSQDDIYRFLHEMVRDRAFPMVLSTKPIWYDSHPMMKVLAQFKTWPMKQTAMIWEDVVKYTIRTGDVTRLIGFLTGTLIAGELYNILRDMLYGKKESAAFSEDLPKALLNDLADGGIVGVLADLTYGIKDWSLGVSIKTGENLLDAAQNVWKSPDLIPEALDKLATQEITLYRQGKELAKRLDSGDMSESYTQWRAKAFEWNDNRKTPGAFAKAASYAEDVIFGKPDYGVGENTLALDLASRHVVAGDIEGAAEYIRHILDRAEDKKAALAGIKGSRTRRSPMGAVPEEYQRNFLLSLDMQGRRDVQRAQSEYIKAYDKAIGMAQRKK